MANSFNHKKIHDVQGYTSLKSLLPSFSRKSIIRSFITLGAIVIIVFGLIKGYQQFVYQVGNFSSQTISLINEAIGDPMIQDEYGNINVLILGFGGIEHRGGFLTDSMLVASFDPESKSITMISIPRDLFVNKDNLYKGKINSLFPIKLNEISGTGNIQDNFAEAEGFLREKIEEITGLTIPYYVGVSFVGFEKFVDELGGVTVNVPETLNDPYFPDSDMKGYEPLIIKSGIHTFDGHTALQYARSRKTTSDFSRSYRQQQILFALIKQMKSSMSWNSIGKIKKLYHIYQDTVYTNISLNNALSMSKYKDDINHFHSFVFSYDCATNYELMEPGCMLYTPDREQFGGGSVLLPRGATATNVSYYKRLQDFVYFVVHNQEFLNENAHIKIENAIDKVYATRHHNYRKGRANTLARKLKQYGFTVYDIDNAENNIPHTIVHTYNDNFEYTVKLLKLFIDFQEVHHEGVYSGDASVDIDIQLGNDFIDQINNKTHKRLLW